MNTKKKLWVILAIAILLVFVIAKIVVFATVVATKLITQGVAHSGVICELSEDWKEQNGCYIKMAVKFEDESYCDKINSTDNLADSCRQIVSQIK